MSQVGVRGGMPQVLRIAATSTIQHFVLRASSSHLVLRADAACRVFFRREDADAGTNYVVVPAPSADHPHGEWAGPAWVPALYVQSVSGTANLEVVAFLRLA